MWRMRKSIDAVMDWLVLNNGDADAAARGAQSLRGSAFWTLWDQVRRDLALQTMVGKVVLDVHSAVGHAASRRPERSLVAEPIFGSLVMSIV